MRLSRAALACIVLNWGLDVTRRCCCVPGSIMHIRSIYFALRPSSSGASSAELIPGTLLLPPAVSTLSFDAVERVTRSGMSGCRYSRREVQLRGTIDQMRPSQPTATYASCNSAPLAWEEQAPLTPTRRKILGAKEARGNENSLGWCTMSP